MNKEKKQKSKKSLLRQSYGGQAKNQDNFKNSKSMSSDDGKEEFVKKEQYHELENKYKRALADYQNLVKQTAQERLEFVKYANEQLLYDILPIYDNLKMSLRHADKEVEKNGWLKGIQYVVKQFKSALKERGVEEIKTTGEKFDPLLMEAIEGKGEKVKKEVMSGYKLNGKIIIPAKVILE